MSSVLHTVAEPPYDGRISFATSGCTTNSRPAPTNAVVPNRAARIHVDRPTGGCVSSSVGSSATTRWLIAIVVSLGEQ